MVIWATSKANAGNNRCLGLFADAQVACVATPDAKTVIGPMARAGTVDSITALAGLAPLVGKSWVVQVLDAGTDGDASTGTVVASCTVSALSTTCGASTSGSVAAGHFLAVQVPRTRRGMSPFRTDLG